MGYHVGDLSQDIALSIQDSVTDLSTITDATLQVQKPDGTEVTWTAVLSGQTATTLTLTYTTNAVTSDLDIPGEWRMYGVLVNTGVLVGRTDTDTFRVEPKYGLPWESWP